MLGRATFVYVWWILRLYMWSTFESFGPRLCVYMIVESMSSRAVVLFAQVENVIKALSAYALTLTFRSGGAFYCCSLPGFECCCSSISMNVRRLFGAPNAKSSVSMVCVCMIDRSVVDINMKRKHIILKRMLCTACINGLMAHTYTLYNAYAKDDASTDLCAETEKPVAHRQNPHELCGHA